MKVPVLLPNIFDHPFTYSSKEKLKIGDYVEVPFGKKKMIGIIWDDFEEEPKKKFKIKDIIKKFTKDPLENKTIKFLNWFSDYNIVPKGMALKLHLINNSLITNRRINWIIGLEYRTTSKQLIDIKQQIENFIKNI